jgi:hypothetical protein
MRNEKSGGRYGHSYKQRNKSDTNNKHLHKMNTTCNFTHVSNTNKAIIDIFFVRLSDNKHRLLILYINPLKTKHRLLYLTLIPLTWKIW